jgi:hypothetical protein
MRVGTICRPLMAASALLLAGAAPPADRGEAFSTREEIAGLFKRLGVRYLPEQEVADRRIDEVPAEESLKFTGWEVVHRRRIKKYAEGIRSHRLAPVYVKRVNDIVGYGLYAADTIETGSMIGEYAGVAKAAEDVPDTSYSWSYTLRRAGSAEKMKVIVDALKAGNEMRFVNHSETAAWSSSRSGRLRRTNRFSSTTEPPTGRRAASRR